MSTTKYEFDEIPYGTAGWNTLLTSNMQYMDSYLNTYLRYTVASGESLSEGDPLTVQNQSWYKAQADGVRQPTLAVAIEAGTSGEYVRGQRCGEQTYSGWSFSGSGEVYLSISGELTQTSPGGAYEEIIGACAGETQVIIKL